MFVTYIYSLPFADEPLYSIPPTVKALGQALMYYFVFIGSQIACAGVIILKFQVFVVTPGSITHITTILVHLLLKK